MHKFSFIDLAILQMLELTPLHGYAMTTKLEWLSGGVLHLPAGTLYPALHKMEREGLIWNRKIVNGKRTRRVYSLTSTGYATLMDQKANWQLIVNTMTSLLNAQP